MLSTTEILASVESPGDRDYYALMIPALDEVSSALPGALEYFARTWYPDGGGEILQICLEGGVNASIREERLRDIFVSHGLSFTRQGSSDVSSPLWNAGVGGNDFLAVSRELYRRATPVIVGLVRSWRSSGQTQAPLEESLRMMIAHSRATLHNSPQTSLSGYTTANLLTLRLLSYRSHYEAILARVAHPREFESLCERKYESLGYVAREAILGGTLSSDSSDEPISCGWSSLIRSVHTSLISGFRRGDLLDAGKSLEDLEREVGRPLEPTRFHARMSPAMHSLMYENHDFLAFRLETSLLYSVLFTLGYSLPERYLLCYVVARANEELAGRTVNELRDELDGLAVRVANVAWG